MFVQEEEERQELCDPAKFCVFFFLCCLLPLKKKIKKRNCGPMTTNICPVVYSRSPVNEEHVSVATLLRKVTER